jgi:hypothetical protein
MSRGIFLLAQNTNEENYVKQACFCAFSIKQTNPELSVTLATNDFVPTKYEKYFDNIISIPGEDLAVSEDWKVSNRVKIYDLTPYDETIVLDTDMLVLSDISNWWELLKDYDLYFTSQPKTYRGEVLTSNFYRRTFVENKLPNIYVGMHYFKKSDLAKEFYKWLKIIAVNYKEFYKQHLESRTPNFCSIDVSSAIAIKILDCESKVTNKSLSFPSFVHMKPKAQNWVRQVSSWQEYVAAYITDDFEFKIGNYKQTGIFHYTENSFVKNYLESRIKELANG